MEAYAFDGDDAHILFRDGKPSTDADGWTYTEAGIKAATLMGDALNGKNSEGYKLAGSLLDEETAFQSVALGLSDNLILVAEGKGSYAKIDRAAGAVDFGGNLGNTISGIVYGWCDQNAIDHADGGHFNFIEIGRKIRAHLVWKFPIVLIVDYDMLA